MISFVRFLFTELNIDFNFRIRTKYSEKYNVGKDKVGLIYKGKAVNDTDTPILLGFKAGDIVYVK